MTRPAKSPSKPDRTSNFIKSLHNPTRLRTLVTVVVLLVAYGAVYSPLSGQIDDASRTLIEQKKRLELARDIERLRKQHEAFRNRLPTKSDTNEWVEYVLTGVRRFPLKLVALDSDPIRDIGPYKAVVLRAELEGAFPDVDGFLRWIESNERLFRIDMVRIQPHRSAAGTLILQLTILGVMA